MARISLLRYGHSLAELELFYITALLLIDVLGEKETRYHRFLEVRAVISATWLTLTLHHRTPESHLVREATALVVNMVKPVLRLVHSTA